jgi:dienelactone hydrolase
MIFSTSHSTVGPAGAFGGRYYGDMNPERLNAMLEACVRDLADMTFPGSREQHRQGLPRLAVKLRRALGLEPLPPRTDLRSEVVWTRQPGPVRVQGIRYESRPGLPATAHLYLPDGERKHPVVVHGHGRWRGKKAAPWVQARAIGLALHGIASLVVDSPGRCLDEDAHDELAEMGSGDEPMLSMGAPQMGQYVWDLVRGLDYLATRPDLDASRAGVTGEGMGGMAAGLAFALDERIFAAALACSSPSLEVWEGVGPSWGRFPLLLAGDWAEVLGLRAPSPLLLMAARDDPEHPAAGHERTIEKLRAVYRPYRAEHEPRLEIFEGPHDYNRRMRESMYAFFCEALADQPGPPYLPEPLPMTDGAGNPVEANTLPVGSEELIVGAEGSGPGLAALLERQLQEPYPERYDVDDRLMPWGKYGRLDPIEPGRALYLHDEGWNVAEDHSIEVPVGRLDVRLCTLLGMSVAEVLAQMLHYRIPGKPAGWEKQAMGGPDALSSMIASMRTLLESSVSSEEPIQVIARGEVASMTARYLQLMRPELELETSHQWGSWLEVAKTGCPELAHPAARYLAWPF